MDIMKSIQACHPHSKAFLSLPAQKPLADMYNLADTQTLEGQLAVAQRLFTDKDKFTTKKCVPSIVLPSRCFLYLVKNAMTIAVSSASCERSFSALKRIKTYLRSTMGDQCLSDLGIFCFERFLQECSYGSCL